VIRIILRPFLPPRDYIPVWVRNLEISEMLLQTQYGLHCVAPSRASVTKGTVRERIDRKRKAVGEAEGILAVEGSLSFSSLLLPLLLQFLR